MLLDRSQVCEHLNVGRDEFYRLIRTGRLKYLRLGRGYRVPASELEAFIARELERQGVEE